MTVCFFGAEVYAFSLEDGGITGSEIGSMSICTDQRNQGNDKKKKDQVWIGDVRVGCVDKDAKGNNYRQSFVCVVGVHREKKLNDKDDYYWLDIATFFYGWRQPIQQSGGCSMPVEQQTGYVWNICFTVSSGY